MDHKSATQLTDPLLSSYNEAAADESVVLPTTWLRYLKYMSIIAETLSRNDKGAGLRLMFVEDARSRRYEQPPHIPAELGTPAEFKERVAGHEFEIRKRFSRREHVLAIRVYSLPPDEDEDLDPADEPAGHWEGLKWLPDPAK